MIAIDSSSFVRFLDGVDAPDTQAVVDAMRSREAALPPVVVAELLSNPEMSLEIRALVLDVKQLDIDAAIWSRAGLMRAELRRQGYKARLADTMIAQSCIDASVALITWDHDFRHFAAFGLVLIGNSAAPSLA